jgi:hypothetical protein
MEDLTEFKWGVEAVHSYAATLMGGFGGVARVKMACMVMVMVEGLANTGSTGTWRQTRRSRASGRIGYAETWQIDKNLYTGGRFLKILYVGL